MAISFSLFMLVVLLIVGWFHKMGGFGVETDFYWSYAPDAERIIHGHNTQEPGVGPLYPLTLGLTNLLVGDYFVSGKLISIFSAVLAGYFIFLLLQSLFDDKVAFFTMVLFHAAVLPFAIVASTDLFFSLLFVSSLYVFYRGGEITMANLLFSGVLMGLAFLTRHNGVVLPISVALIVLLLNPSDWAWTDRVKGVGLFLGVFVLINLPWNLVQWFSSGEPVRSDSYLIIASNFYGKPGVVASEDMKLAAEKFDSLASVVFYDFPHFVRHYLSNIYHHFYDLLINSLKFPAFLFVGAGALLWVPKMTRKQLSLFVFALLSYLLLCLVHYEPRYYLYLIFFFMLFVAYFLFGNPSDKRWTRIASLAFAVTVAFLSLFSAKEIMKNIQDEPRELLSIARQMQGQVHANEAIIARKPHIGFLTNLRTIYFPQVKSVAELLQFAREHNADYLIYGTEEEKRRPELRRLLEPQNLPGEIEPWVVWEHPKTIVYKFNFTEAINSG